MPDKNRLSLKDAVSLAASIAALIISLFIFFRDSIFNQHVLRAAVVSVDNWSSADRIKARVLLVNSGKHYETLYSASFIFAQDLSSGGGRVSAETIGPTVVKPGEAIVLDLDAAMPDVQSLITDASVSNSTAPPTKNFGVHVGVVFNALTPSGELLDQNDKIYRFTEMLFEGMQYTGSKPRAGDDKGLIDLI